MKSVFGVALPLPCIASCQWLHSFSFLWGSLSFRHHFAFPLQQSRGPPLLMPQRQWTLSLSLFHSTPEIGQSFWSCESIPSSLSFLSSFALLMQFEPRHSPNQVGSHGKLWKLQQLPQSLTLSGLEPHIVIWSEQAVHRQCNGTCSNGL